MNFKAKGLRKENVLHKRAWTKIRLQIMYILQDQTDVATFNLKQRIGPKS